MAVRNVAFESAVCKYKQLTSDERIRMIAENEEKAWKDRQAELDYAMDEGIQKGIQKGRIEGRAEGKHNREIEIAKSLLNSGLDYKFIALHTGLSKEEIEKLR